MHNGIYFEQCGDLWECYWVKRHQEVATSRSRFGLVALLKTLIKGMFS